jgi:glycosyltransferase involved in cell wall biosynthesis
MKNILMIAFHYPPVKGSSGVHRTLAFSRYLPEYGFKPIVLTVKKRTYSNIDNSLASHIPEDLIVARASAFDTARDFSIKGYYPLFFALPDRWQSWIFTGVLKGLELIRRHRPDIIWSTYPIASAHMIALILHKITKVPWIADFRDSMTEANYPKNNIVRYCYRWIEKRAVKNAMVSVFTAPSAKKMYIARYGIKFSERFVVIENGIDEIIFKKINTPLQNTMLKKKPYKFIHSGLLYQEERNPEHFFKAIRILKETGSINASKLKIILRASGNEAEYQNKIDSLQISDIIHFADPIPYKEALLEMLTADGLLLFQGSSCNHQIPAKIYEYLRTGLPIIGLGDARGDTCQLLKKAGHSYMADLNSAEEIANCIEKIMNDLENNQIQTEKFVTDQFDRKYRAKQLSEIINNTI